MMNDRLAKAPAITANHALLTAAWIAEVKALEGALGRITDARVSRDCRVTFFEIAGDQHLHVNVMRKSTTGEVNGWSGPGTTPDGGIVYNRKFTRIPRYQVLRQIKEVVFGAPS
jgi:hypothetical protein